MTMAYKRKISYFDLIEDEQKRGNAGFVKWEKYDECHILSVFVSGLNRVSDREAKVFLEDNVLGMLIIRNRRAEGTYILTKGEKNWKEEIDNIRIPIAENSELVAVFENQEPVKNEDFGTDEGPENEGAIIKEEVFETVKDELEEVLSEIVYEQKEETLVEELPIEPDAVSDKEKGLWEQLQETHKPFYPFNNEIECYRIFPKDIKLLHANYHSLQNNQFLLHGYYNYRYLILFQKRDTENEYWLGVPGIYHEREKMAARMFGFEKYEGTKRDYHTGDLGYYLITVE